MKYGTVQQISQNFALVNTIFERLKFLEHQKAAIYRCLAAIIHLGNVEIQDENLTSEACVKESSNTHIETIAALMKLASADELRDLLVFRSLDVCGSAIK